jgi:hypothetical protein
LELAPINTAIGRRCREFSTTEEQIRSSSAIKIREGEAQGTEQSLFLLYFSIPLGIEEPVNTKV